MHSSGIRADQRQLVGHKRLLRSQIAILNANLGVSADDRLIKLSFRPERRPYPVIFTPNSDHPVSFDHTDSESLPEARLSTLSRRNGTMQCR